MLKIAFAVAVVTLMLAGCGKPSQESSARERLRVQGSQLATFNGCDRCHAETGYVLGPSWRAIAARYKDNPNAARILISSIKNGSSGKWTAMTRGQVMPPLGARVGDEDLKVIVAYILSLSK